MAEAGTGGGAEANGERGPERGRGPARSLAGSRARPLPPSHPPSLRARGLAPSRFPGDEGRGGAEAGTRFGRRPEVSAAGLGGGGLGGGILGRARARRRAPVLPAPPPAGCVAPRPRACACVRAFRRCAPGRDAEVKFGERGRDPSARGARVAAITEPSATAGAGEGGRVGAATATAAAAAAAAGGRAGVLPGSASRGARAFGACVSARAGGARGQREASREWRRRRRRERSPGMSLPPPPPGPLPLRRRRRRPALLGRTWRAGCAGPAAPLPPGTLARPPPPPVVTSSRGWGRAAGSSPAGWRRGGTGRLKGREAGEGPLSPQVTGPGSAEACCCCCSPSSRRPRQASAPRAPRHLHLSGGPEGARGRKVAGSAGWAAAVNEFHLGRRGSAGGAEPRKPDLALQT